MDFNYSEKTNAVREKLTHFIEDLVLPRLAEHYKASEAGDAHPPVVDDLKALAKDAGLWNLFLPSLRDDEPGTGLTNLEYAPLAEIMGRVSWSSEIFNCSAPDTGNMELLHMFASPAQYEQWLKPLLQGDIRSAFAMTEPDVPSSDATNIQTSIVRDGDDYVINGRKWFISGVAHPNCKLLILMGKTDPDNEDRHKQQSMVLVPLDTPGVEVLRNITTMNHHTPHGHCELVFRDVRVPVENLLGEEGGGFMMAQARLGPGRIHHCMRAIGQAELALELMVARSQERKTFGKFLYQHGAVADWIAHSRIEIEQARLLVLKAAWMIDNVGAKAAAKEISLIKALIPTVHTSVCDRAMQVFGAMGISPDTPLADMWTYGRTLRYADGPDEVHLQKIARMEIKESEGSLDKAARYLRIPER